MDAAELLRSKARDYEILAASFAERASFSAENGPSAVGYLRKFPAQFRVNHESNSMDRIQRLTEDESSPACGERFRS